MSGYPFREKLWGLVLLMTAEVAFAAPSTLTFEKVQEFGPQYLEQNMLPTLTMGRDGNLYGTAQTIVFRIDHAGVYSTYHTSTEGDVARLVVGNDGFLYGFTGKSPAGEDVPGAFHGVFFRLDHQGTYTSLLALPRTIETDLVVGSDGAFYGGTAQICGDEYCFRELGAMIKITSSGGYTLLETTTFDLAMSPQVVGSDGALYGIRSTEMGRPEESALFRLDTAGNLTTFYQMTAAQGFLEHFVFGSNGLLYAASNSSGNYNGSLIGLDNTGAVAVTHSFDYTGGAAPRGSLTVGGDGAIYGVTESGGTNGTGTVYRVDSAGTFTSVYSFAVTSSNPQQGLVLAKDGALYGVTSGGSPFRVDSSGTVSYPRIPILEAVSPLVQGSDCGLYGAAITGFDRTAVYRLFEPGHLCQTIEFAALPDRVVGAPPFTVSAAASSGLPVSFSASGSCSVSGDEVTVAEEGLCTLTASQIGDERFGPADEVSQVFTVPEPERVASLWAGCLLLGVLARRRAASTRGLTRYSRSSHPPRVT